MDASTLARCTGATLSRAQAVLDGVNAAMAAYDIDTPIRQAMFLPNVGHETTRLVNLQELGGPAYFARYEGRADLGNVRPGDGAKFHGRGMLQTTGRANYARLRDRLRAKGIDCPDFEQLPDAVAAPQWAAMSAADYVDMRRLNAKADANDFLGYCIGINGRNKATGLPNGWAERKDLYDDARKALGLT